MCLRPYESARAGWMNARKYLTRPPSLVVPRRRSVDASSAGLGRHARPLTRRRRAPAFCPFPCPPFALPCLALPCGPVPCCSRSGPRIGDGPLRAQRAERAPVSRATWALTLGAAAIRHARPSPSPRDGRGGGGRRGRRPFRPAQHSRTAPHRTALTALALSGTESPAPHAWEG